MLKKLLLLSILLASPALGQSVQQSGTVTRNQVPVWVTSGVIGGSQSAPSSSTDSVISSLGVTNEGGAGFCVSSQRQSAAGRNQLCLGASTAGPAVISLQNYGNALPQNLNFVINGIPVTIPTGGGSFIFGNAPFTVGGIPTFANSNGVIQNSGLVATAGVITAGTWQGSPIAIVNGGCGATTISGCLSNLGIGTMGLQNAISVAVTGGSITGMPTPVNPTDVAIKSYVDATATGLNILAPSLLATAAVLPNTPTYANGTLGVGATLTAGSNTTLTVDGTVATLNNVVLVKNQASAFQNGIYTVTTAGSGAAAWVLTRATYFDQAAEMKVGSYTLITSGTANANTSWTLQSTVVTVGTDALNFVQFSASATGTVTSATLTAGTGISLSGTCTSTTIFNCVVTSTNGAATGVTYTPPGSGAVATTVQAELQRMVWIKDYGAKCDNTNDDTASIQAAWNEAAAESVDVWLGGVGPYCKFSSITMPTPVASTYVSGFGEARAAMLHGPGSSQVMLVSTVTGTTCAVNISATYGTNSSLVGKMFGFGVVQSATNQTGTGLCLSGITKLTFEDVLVNYFATGINANDTILLNIEKSWFAANTVAISGQQVSNSAPNGWNIRASHFSNNQLFTIRIAQPCLVNIDGGNDFESNGTTGSSGITIFVNGFCVTSGALGVNVKDNYFEGNQGVDLQLSQGGATVSSIHSFVGNNVARTHTTYSAGVLLVNNGTGQTNIILGGNGLADTTGSPGTFGGWADVTSTGSLNFTYNCTQSNIVIPNSGIDFHCSGARVSGGQVVSDSNGQYIGLN